MPDMLVKLYNLPNDWAFLAQQQQAGVTIRKPLGSEKHLVIDWVRATFSDAWASEADQAMSNRPLTCFLATSQDQSQEKSEKPQQKLIGFSCYDTAALGFFGPIGVEQRLRGRGVGAALLKACLLDMKLKGYGYAIIGWTNALGFYEKGCGATAIPDSSPSIWKGVLSRPSRQNP